MKPSFTLVHGTWSPNAPWTRSTSVLTERLRARFGHDTAIASIDWKGWNRVGTRSRGADVLCEHVRGLPSRPDERHFLIAHSHGGNVALYAMRKPEVAARVAGIATVATPFLVAGQRRLNERLEWALMTLAVPMIYAIVWFAGATGDRLGGGWATWLVFIALAALLFAGLWKVARAWRAFADRIVDAMRFGPIPRERLLILRSPGDEASIILLASRALLAVGMVLLTAMAHLCAALERLLARSRDDVRFGWAVGLGTLLTWVGLLAVAAYGVEYRDAWATPALLLVFAIAAWLVMPILMNAIDDDRNVALFTWNWLLATVMLAAVVLPSLLMLLYGWQLAVANLLVDVSAEATPLGEWRVVTLASGHPVGDASTSALTHSTLYDDERAITMICDWVAEVLAEEARGTAG